VGLLCDIPAADAHRGRPTQEPRVTIAVAEGCPWSNRALRMLRSLGIPYQRVSASAGSLPQVSIDGQPIGGYSELAELHGRGGLEPLRSR